MTDFEVMQRVFDLAAKGGRNVAPNPLVGCVITKNGKIIGEGWHKKYGGHHAEVNAIRDCQKKFGKDAAKKLLHKSTFFVNLEPCSIEKNTPPCTDKLIEFRAKKLVCSIKDPNPLINGRGIKKLKQAGIDVQLGLMKDDARRLNKIFIANHLYSRPFITIKVAQTLDSKIGLRGAGQVRITNNKSIKDVHKLRKQHDSIMIGSGTLNEDTQTQALLLATDLAAQENATDSVEDLLRFATKFCEKIHANICDSERQPLSAENIKDLKLRASRYLLNDQESN